MNFISTLSLFTNLDNMHWDLVCCMGFECSFSHVSSDLSDKMVMFLNSSQASFVHAMCWLLADISQILLVYCPGIDLTKNLSRT